MQSRTSVGNRAAEGPSPFEDAARTRDGRPALRPGRATGWETRETVHLHYYQDLSIKGNRRGLEHRHQHGQIRLREALKFLRSKTAEPKISTNKLSGDNL